MSGCAKNSHIPTIWDLYLASETGKGSTLKSAIIEAKRGDVFYARLFWETKTGMPYYNPIGITDALILSAKSGASLKIVRQVFNEMDALDDIKEWPYDQEIIDMDFE